MYTLITANRNYSSWSLRPWLMMRELGIDFQDRFEPFAAQDNRAAFRTFSPSGTVPVLIDGGRTIHDSLGIIMYLADRHEGVWPKDADARGWAQAIVAEMHGGFGALRNDCTMNVGVRVRPKPMSPALQRDVARIREIFEEGLARFGGPWLAGANFSAADAFYAPVAYRVRTYGLDAGAGQAWVDHVIASPNMQQWENAALSETYREAEHEAELATCGDVVADYRAI